MSTPNLTANEFTAHLGLDHALKRKCKLSSKEGDIYRVIVNMISRHRKEIIENYPKKEIVRRNTGYPLDYLANCQPWNPDGPVFNLAPFLCGTEGTLALITKAVLRLVPTVREHILICVHFEYLNEAMQAVPYVLQHDPVAVELMDKRILDLASENLEQNRNRFWIDGDPAAVLAIEFFAETKSEAQNKAAALVRDMQQQGLVTRTRLYAERIS